MTREHQTFDPYGDNNGPAKQEQISKVRVLIRQGKSRAEILGQGFAAGAYETALHIENERLNTWRSA